ncbi:hypothetical protein EUX98_g6874 [Antrodiella citrinella]|uniref:Pet127-domain-containing protein n=1 Tax=Antrodiella citrinella TaxID=2447956 RepID=A0A4S4MMX9_9APHY|nr:hypothetical protein EUX98_g6874 [Antrodiella citrinella]
MSFSPGVHWIRDPRSRVYNFSPWLQGVPKLSTFDFDRVTGFIRSSKDATLFEATVRENCKFAGSTSSLTGTLSHIYMLLSRFHPLNFSRLSSAFAHLDPTFSYGQRLPAAVILNYRDGVYLTDADSSLDSDGTMVLSYMGTMLEKFFTVPKAEFQTFLRDAPLEPDSDPRREAYRYAKYGNYMMRSQLDCQDNRLPGTGVFDIKTRAAKPLRIDPLNVEEGSGYLLRTLFGRYESFESEYHDLIRSAFLKYSMQARIGNMDGVMVAYHNTAQVFGFQYISLEEMDEALYGNSAVGQDIFTGCVSMLEAINTEVVACFPQQTVSCLWKTADDGQVMHVFVEPTHWEPSTEGEEKPIVQLDIVVENRVDGRLIEDVVNELEDTFQWNITYSINHVDEPYSEIRARHHGFALTKERFLPLPSDTTLEQMEELWSTGMGTGQAQKTAFDPSKISATNSFINNIRRRSRKGAEDTMRMRKEDRGKKVVIWTQRDDEQQLEDWEQDVIDEGLALSEEAADAAVPETHSSLVRSTKPRQLRLQREPSNTTFLRYQKAKYDPWDAVQSSPPSFQDLVRARDELAIKLLRDMPYAAAALMYDKMKMRLSQDAATETVQTTKPRKTTAPQDALSQVKTVRWTSQAKKADSAQKSARQRPGPRRQATTPQETVPATSSQHSQPSKRDGRASTEVARPHQLGSPPAIDISDLMILNTKQLKKGTWIHAQTASLKASLIRRVSRPQSPSNGNAP